MASREKIGAASAFTVLPLADISGIITDAPADHPVIQELRHTGTTIIRA